MDEIDVSLRSVTKRFDGVGALNGLSLDVRKGEFLALLGPSGCGKSTLLNLIAGFLDPDEGEILIRDRSMNGVKPFRRDVGMVFQNYALFPHMTVRQNVEFGLEMRGRRRHERAAGIDEALGLVHLVEFGQRYPDQLSGGQQQRVALARVLAIRPSVLLLDEPLAALDRQLREEMQVELRYLQKRVGITTIFVTHDQEEALTMADRVAVIRAGAIEQIGTPSDIYEHPATSFVANFIGTSNTFEGTVEAAGEGRVRVTTPDGALLGVARSPGGGRGRLMVRPEKMRLCRVPEAGLNALGATLQDAVYLGTHTRYFATLASGKRVTIYQQNATSPGDATQAFASGEKLHVVWDPLASVLLPEDG